MSNVRVRFAPSPTGFFHIGSARTALFNWLFARNRGGTFVLRIEDTDAERNTPEALRVLLEGMRWLGLNWDEGPEAGGAYGPYFQSQRQSVYQEYLDLLRKSDRAYDQDGAVYFRISGHPQIIEDAIRGRVERTEEKDFVIWRSNGTPVFHFVNVVDDITMGISHVIRGEDHLSNTSKHTELYRAWGASLPVFAHIPLILKQNGPGKMSKRDEGALIEEYAGKGYLPEAVVNYLSLLGWSPKDDREKMPIDEIIRLFDLSGVNRNNARFDEKKLSFLNAAYLQELSEEAYLERAESFLRANALPQLFLDEVYLREVLLICREKLRSIQEIPDYIPYFFSDTYPFEEKAVRKIFAKGDPLSRVREFSGALPGLENFTEEELEAAVQQLAAANGVTSGDYIHAVRLALSGRSVGPGFYALVRVLGANRVRARLEAFLHHPPSLAI